MENVSKVIHLPHSALHSYHLRVSLHYQFISRKFDEKNTEATCILISSSSMRTTHTHTQFPRHQSKKTSKLFLLTTCKLHSIEQNKIQSPTKYEVYLHQIMHGMKHIRLNTFQ